MQIQQASQVQEEKSQAPPFDGTVIKSPGKLYKMEEIVEATFVQSATEHSQTLLVVV